MSSYLLDTTLAGRLRSSRYAPQVERAAADLDRRVAAGLRRIAQKLEPLTGTVTPRAAGLTYPEAMELYTVVHQVAFLSKSGDSLILSEALPRLADLIQHK